MIITQISTATEMTMAADANEALSIFDLLLKGGYMMVPLLILSISAIVILVERVLSINNASKTPAAFMDEIKRLVLGGNINEARLLCSKTNTPIARMVEKGISRIGSPLKNIEVSIENVGKIELYKLEKNLSLLATISGAAPMMGFLGTVTGMIQAFIAIAQEEGSVSPKLLSSGIYEAMITTAVGLLIGIVAYLSYNYLVTRVQKLVHKMEYTTVDFIDLLQEPGK